MGAFRQFGIPATRLLLMAWRPCPAPTLIWIVCCAALAGQPLPHSESDSGDSEGEVLALENLDLLDSRDGFAIPPDSVFVPGETIHLYFQIKGYQVGEENRIRLGWAVDAFDPQGRRFFPADSGEIDTELAPQDKGWMPPVRYSPRIPDHAGGGTYLIRVSVRDELAETAVSEEVRVEVDAARVRAAERLLVREFRFMKEEHGTRAGDSVFRPGDEIWASFFITGYKTEDDHTYDVESNAWVVDAEGKVMFAFEPGGEQGKPYYPRLWLPAKLRMDLQPDIEPGEYTVVLKVRDDVGGTDATERYSFHVQ